MAQVRAGTPFHDPIESQDVCQIFRGGQSFRIQKKMQRWPEGFTEFR